MNNTLDSFCESDLEQNFNVALKMISNTYDYNDLIELLNSTEIVKKQFAALNLMEIKAQEDADLLVANLVGQNGKVREAVAFKLNELVKNTSYQRFFLNSNLYNTYLQGIMDINGNVCRQIVEVVEILGKNQHFCDYICKTLPETISEILNNIKNIDINDKKYVVSKVNFQLYWCLEALLLFVGKINLDNIRDIIQITAEFDDYTIREKAAKILAKILTANNSNFFVQLKEKLKNDENYYVRRYLT